jgi:hypothetical protein
LKRFVANVRMYGVNGTRRVPFEQRRRFWFALQPPVFGASAKPLTFARSIFYDTAERAGESG